MPVIVFTYKSSSGGAYSRGTVFGNTDQSVTLASSAVLSTVQIPTFFATDMNNSVQMTFSTIEVPTFFATDMNNSIPVTLSAA